jgi:tetratricopeptide (TPR) repeat protein
VTDPAQRRGLDELARARDAYDSRSWLTAYESFSRAEEEAPFEAEDLELYATTLLMLGRDDDAIAILERAHHRYLERAQTRRAVRDATWIGMNLAYRGAVGPAAGWLGRAQRLLDQEPGEAVERGYLLIPQVFRHQAAGDFEAAAAIAREAVGIAQRFGDRDLLALALHAEGHMLVLAGHLDEGFALLDEAMVTVTTGDLSPFVVGIVYCGVILACQSVFEVGRARE